jgi:hypothetical protein
MASVEARIHYANGAGRPLRYVVDMNLRDVSITPALIPLPINALAGQLLLNEDQAISNSFAGITCGGHFSGAAVVYYGGEGDLPSYGARLRFDQLDLSDLLECFTGERKDLSGRIMGVLDIGGIVGRESSRAGRGTLNLTEGHLWHTPLFAKLLPVLHLRIPTDGGASARGQMIYTLSGDQISVHEFELTGGGLNLSGYGTVWLDGRLKLTMVAVGAPKEGAGIPFLSPAFEWLMQAVERELLRLDVSGTLKEPVVQHRVLSTIAWPLTGLRGILLSPILGGRDALEEEP